jgi:putative membrane protein
MRLPPWHLHPDVWLVLGSVLGLYLVAVRRHRRATGERTRTRKVVLFSTGMAVLWLGADWPMHDLAEGYLYSIHMLQHLLFTLVAAPLLIAGMPEWMLRTLLRPAPVARVFGFVTRPLMAIVFFNGVLLFTHWPAVVEASVGTEVLHLALHVLIVAAALVMWWPIMSPLPAIPPLPLPGQMLYLFFQSLAPTIPASFLTFGDRPLYPVYATFPRIWGIDALEDQLIAGLTMKIGGGLILWGVIAVVFFTWFAQEQRDGWDPLQWRRFERGIHDEMEQGSERQIPGAR